MTRIKTATDGRRYVIGRDGQRIYLPSPGTVDAESVLDAAAAAREVATLTALALLQAGAQYETALNILAKLDRIAPPESIFELDCVTIGAQAIRDAQALRGGAE